MYSFKFLEAEREIELDVSSGIGVVGQFLVIVEAVILRTHAKAYMPFHTVFLPFGEPFHLGAGTAEELHLHLFEFPHPEYELTGYDFVAECFSYLGDSERYLHSAGLLDVEVFHEYSLGGLRTEIDLVVRRTGVAYRGAEHQVELPYVGPIGGSGDRAYYSAVHDDVPVGLEVVGFFRGQVTGVDLVIFLLLPQYIGIGGTELLLVEGVSEPLASLLDLLVHLLLDLSEIILDKIVGAVTLLGVLVVDERIVKGRDMTGGDPGLGVHEHAGIDTDYVLMKAGHRSPPVILDVVLEFDSVLAVVIDGRETIVDLA